MSETNSTAVNALDQQYDNNTNEVNGTAPTLTRAKSSNTEGTVEVSSHHRRSYSVTSDEFSGSQGKRSPRVILGRKSPTLSTDTDTGVLNLDGAGELRVHSLSPSNRSRKGSPRGLKVGINSPFEEGTQSRTGTSTGGGGKAKGPPKLTGFPVASPPSRLKDNSNPSGTRPGTSSQTNNHGSKTSTTPDTHSLILHGNEYPEEIRLNPEVFPHLNAGDIVEVFIPDNPEGSRLLLEVTTMEKVQGSFSVSLNKTIAGVREVPFQLYSQVVVRKADPKEFKTAFVEVTFKDQYVSQGEFYRLKLQLHGKPIFKGKRLQVEGISATVEEITDKNHEQVTCGMILKSTKLIFRSKSARLFWLVQMSKEMWDFASDGELYFERFVNQLVSEIFDRWQAKEVSHSLTLVFFTRTFYNKKPTSRELKSILCATSLLVGDVVVKNLAQKNYDDRWYIDMYHTVLENESRPDWHTLRPLLKHMFLVFPKICGWSIPAARAAKVQSRWAGHSAAFPSWPRRAPSHSRSVSDSVVPATDLARPNGPLARSLEADAVLRHAAPGSPDDVAEETIHGLPSTAQEGNLLEAVSLCLNVLDKHYMDRDLKRTGQAVVLFTAGSGVFEVDRELTRMIKHRMLDNAIGCDVMSITRAPLHMAPLFVFKPSTTTVDLLDTPHPYASPKLYVLGDPTAVPTGLHRSHSHVGSMYNAKSSAASHQRLSSMDSDGVRRRPSPGYLGHLPESEQDHSLALEAEGDADTEGSVHGSVASTSQAQEVKPVFNVPHWIHLSFPFHGSTAQIVNNQLNEEFQPLPTNRMFRLHNPTRTSIPRALVIAMRPELAEEWYLRLNTQVSRFDRSAVRDVNASLPPPPPPLEIQSEAKKPARTPGSPVDAPGAPTAPEAIPNRLETASWYPLGKLFVKKAHSPVVDLVNMSSSFSSQQSVLQYGSLPEGQDAFTSPYMVPLARGVSNDSQNSSAGKPLDPWHERYEKMQRAQRSHDLKVFKDPGTTALGPPRHGSMHRSNTVTGLRLGRHSASETALSSLPSSQARTLVASTNSPLQPLHNPHRGEGSKVLTAMSQSAASAQHVTLGGETTIRQNSVDSDGGSFDRGRSPSIDSGLDIHKRARAVVALGAVAEEDSSFTGRESESTGTHSVYRETSSQLTGTHSIPLETSSQLTGTHSIPVETRSQPTGSSQSTGTHSIPVGTRPRPVDMHSNHMGGVSQPTLVVPGETPQLRTGPSPGSSLSSSFSQDPAPSHSSSYRESTRPSLFGPSHAGGRSSRRLAPADPNSEIHMAINKELVSRNANRARKAHVVKNPGSRSPSLTSVSSRDSPQSGLSLRPTDSVGSTRGPLGLRPLSKSKSIQGFGLHLNPRDPATPLPSACPTPRGDQLGFHSAGAGQWPDNLSGASSFAQGSLDQGVLGSSPTLGPGRLSMSRMLKAPQFTSPSANVSNGPNHRHSTSKGRPPAYEKMNPFQLAHFRSAERRKRTTHNRKRWSHLFPVYGRFDETNRADEYQVEVPLTLESYRPNWKSLFCPGVLPITTEHEPELKDHLGSDVTLTATNEINGYRYRNNQELVIELICQRLSHDFQLYEDVKAVEEDEAVVGQLSNAGVRDKGMVGTIVSQGDRADGRRGSGSAAAPGTGRIGGSKLGGTPQSKSTLRFRERSTPRAKGAQEDAWDRGSKAMEEETLSTEGTPKSANATETEHTSKSTGNQITKASTGNQITKASTGNQINKASTDNQINKASTGNQINKASTGNQINKASTDNQINKASTDNQINKASTDNQLTRASADRKVSGPARTRGKVRTNASLLFQINNIQSRKTEKPMNSSNSPSNQMGKAMNRKLTRNTLKPEQPMDPQSSPEPERTVTLTMEHEVHTFTFRPNSGSISLKKSRGTEFKSKIIDYPCLLFEPIEEKFDYTPQKFALSRSLDNWNNLDGTLSGNSDGDPNAVSAAFRYRRQTFSIIPPRANGVSPWTPHSTPSPRYSLTQGGSFSTNNAANRAPVGGSHSTRRLTMKRRSTAGSNSSEQSTSLPPGTVESNWRTAPASLPERGSTSEPSGAKLSRPNVMGSNVSVRSLENVEKALDATSVAKVAFKRDQDLLRLTPEEEQKAVEDFKTLLKFLQGKVGNREGVPTLDQQVKILTGDQARNPQGTTETVTTKINLRSKNTERFEWIVLSIDSKFSPYQCYHVEVKWLVASGQNVHASFIRPLLLNSWEKSSLSILQIPEYCRSTSAIHNRRVLHTFILQKCLYLSSGMWTNKLEEYIVNMLLTRYNFAIDSKNHHKISDQENDETRNYYSLVHREGLCMMNFFKFGVEFIRNGQKCTLTNKGEEFDKTCQLFNEIEVSFEATDISYQIVIGQLVEEACFRIQTGSYY